MVHFNKGHTFTLSSNNLRISKITKTRLEKKAPGSSVCLKKMESSFCGRQDGVFERFFFLRMNAFERNLYDPLLPRVMDLYSLVERSPSNQKCSFPLRAQRGRCRTGAVLIAQLEGASGRVIGMEGNSRARRQSWRNKGIWDPWNLDVNTGDLESPLSSSSCDCDVTSSCCLHLSTVMNYELWTMNYEHERFSSLKFFLS